MNTRRQIVLVGVKKFALAISPAWLLSACQVADTHNSPTAPSQQPIGTNSLLARIKELGYSARREPYGNNGAAMIWIGDKNNLRFVDEFDREFGIDANAKGPTLDASTIRIPANATVKVR